MSPNSKDGLNKEVKRKKMNVLPYDVKQGEILSVIIEDGEHTTVIPISGINIREKLDILAKIEWDKIKEQTGSFRAEHRTHVMELIQESEIEQKALEFLYKNSTSESSLIRIATVLGQSKSTLSDVLRRLKYAGVVQKTEHKKIPVWSLTPFGMEVCAHLGFSKERKAERLIEKTIE